MAKNKTALVTDLTEIIRSAAEKPEPMLIGQHQDVVEQTVKPEAPKPAKKARAVKPKTPAAKKPEPEKFPWDEANEKIIKLVQVRMPETLHAKLAWIKQESIGVPSVHSLILTTLNAFADHCIERIKKGDRGGHSDA